MERTKQEVPAPSRWASLRWSWHWRPGALTVRARRQRSIKHWRRREPAAKRIAKFSGTVTVDGQPPGIKVYDKHRLVLMLYDPKNPPSASHPILFADCMPEPNDGAFEFSTYDRGDGVPPGEYIALFVDMPTSWGGGYKGVDRFKNRFNDPDRNANVEQFKVNLTEPGHTDWQFNLVTDDPAPKAPGPRPSISPPASKSQFRSSKLPPVPAGVFLCAWERQSRTKPVDKLPDR